jgi:hypothetical protein
LPQPHSQHIFKILEAGGSLSPPQTHSNLEANHFSYVAIKEEMIPSLSFPTVFAFFWLFAFLDFQFLPREDSVMP